MTRRLAVFALAVVGRLFGQQEPNVAGLPARAVEQGLVLVNGKPLPASMQKKVDADMEKTREGRRKQQRSGLRRIVRQVKLAGWMTCLVVLRIGVAGQEMLDGRSVWVVESTPRASAAGSRLPI